MSNNKNNDTVVKGSGTRGGGMKYWTYEDENTSRVQVVPQPTDRARRAESRAAAASQPVTREEQQPEAQQPQKENANKSQTEQQRTAVSTDKVTATAKVSKNPTGGAKKAGAKKAAPIAEKAPAAKKAGKIAARRKPVVIHASSSGEDTDSEGESREDSEDVEEEDPGKAAEDPREEDPDEEQERLPRGHPDYYSDTDWLQAELTTYVPGAKMTDSEIKARDRQCRRENGLDSSPDTADLVNVGSATGRQNSESRACLFFFA